MDALHLELARLGLSEKEAAVYLAALELGPSTVQELAKKAHVNRATAYLLLDTLALRGLVSTFVKGKKRSFAAESPERFLSLLRTQRDELDLRETEFSKALPALLGLFNREGVRPQVRYLEGKEGLATIRDMFSALTGEFIQIVPFDDAAGVRETFGTKPSIKGHMPHRALLVMDHPDASVIPKLPNGEVRVLSSKQFPIHAEISVRGHHVFLYSYRVSLLSVVISSQEIADTIRALFELAWVGAEGGESDGVKK